MPAWHPAAYVRRGLYERIGLYDTRYAGSADHEFFLRALEAGARFVYLPEILSNMQRGGYSQQNFLRSKAESREIRIRYGQPRAAAWWGFLRGVVENYLRFVLLRENRLFLKYRAWKKARRRLRERAGDDRPEG